MQPNTFFHLIFIPLHKNEVIFLYQLGYATTSAERDNLEHYVTPLVKEKVCAAEKAAHTALLNTSLKFPVFKNFLCLFLI